MIDILGNYDCGELIMITNDNVIVIRDGSYQGPDYWGYFFLTMIDISCNIIIGVAENDFLFLGEGES